jgi:hypothetical protein
VKTDVVTDPEETVVRGFALVASWLMHLLELQNLRTSTIHNTRALQGAVDAGLLTKSWALHLVINKPLVFPVAATHQVRLPFRMLVLPVLL